MIRGVYLFCIIIFWSAGALGQVTNNNIENRAKLTLDDDWFASSTTNSTVEWECVNKALTSTCLIYHNDQWFTFSVEKSGTYYVNISNQQCKNKQGVQIIVIEGDPCKIETYRLVECISYTDQSDIYVPLHNIKAGVDYLVNIDGYLGDLCDFNIQVATSLHGVPAKKEVLGVLKLEAASVDSIVTVHWKLPDSLMYRLNSFTLYRKHQLQKSTTYVADIPLTRNALGRALEAYRVTDTLHQQGVHEYLIYGKSHTEGILLLATTNVTYRMSNRSQQSIKPPKTYGVTMNYRSKANEVISVDVYDDSSDRYLFSTTRRASKGSNRFGLDLTPYVDVGVIYFKIVMTGKKQKVEEKYTIKK